MFAKSSIVGMGATVLWIAVALITPATAAVITVANPGFTATLDQAFNTSNAGDPLPQGYFVSGTGANKQIFTEAGIAVAGKFASVSGWSSQDGRSGVVAPVEVTSGNSNVGDVGFLTTLTTNDPDGTAILFQNVPGSVSFLPNSVYTLTADLLLKDVAVSPSFFADLTANGTRVNGAGVYVTPTQATPGSATVTFVTGAIAPVGNLGVIFSATDTSGNLTQLLVDNASLTVAVPEPSSVAFVAMGTLALARRRR